MTDKHVACVGALCLALTLTTAVSAQTVIRPDDIYCGGFAGISADGLSLAGRCNDELFFWKEGSDVVKFPLNLGSPYEVTGVSGDGETVVGNINLTDEGFVARKDLTFETIGWLSTEGANTEISAVDYNGSHVVGSSLTQPLEWQGIVYESETLAAIGYAEGYPHNRVNGISADGTILVGEAFKYPPMSKEGEAFRWTESGFELLGIPAGYLGTVANAVSDDGTVVVGLAYSAVGADYAADGAVWTEGEGWRIIPEMDEVNLVSPEGGAIVGTSFPEGRGWYMELISDTAQTTESILADKFGLGGVINPPLDFTASQDGLYFLWSDGLFILPYETCSLPEVEWNNPAAGSFDDPQSWLTLEVPGVDTVAVFRDLGTEYQINAESSRSLSAIHVEEGASAHLALDPYKLSLGLDCDIVGLKVDGALRVFGGEIESAGVVKVGDQFSGALELHAGAKLLLDNPIGPYAVIDGPTEPSMVFIDQESALDAKYRVTVGAQSGHSGELELEGALVAGNLVVGDAGSGKLTATGSGNIVAEALSIASSTGGQGELILEDSALVFTNCMDIAAGVGSVGTLEISENASVTDECIAPFGGTGRIAIGYHGLGIVNVSDRGLLGGSELQDVDIDLGSSAGGEGQLAITSSADDVADALPFVAMVRVGIEGSGLVQLDGAHVKETDLQIGGLVGSSGVVELLDASWDSKEEVIIGVSGGEGRLELRRSTITAADLTLGFGGGAKGTLNLLEAGIPNVQLLDRVTVGRYGSGEVLVSGGNILASARIEIPFLEADSGGDGEVTVDGADSKIDAAAVLVGGGGNGGTLRVTNGGSVQIGTLTVFGPDGPTTSGGTVAGELLLVGVPDLGKRTIEAAYVYADTLVLRRGAKLEIDSLELGENGVLVVADTMPETLTNPGEISPGESYDSVAKLVFANDYVQTPTGILKIDLGGLDEGEFDIIEAVGTIHVDGVLRVHAVDGYEPQVGDMFTIASGASVWGTFTGIDVVDGFRVDVSYGDNSITITVVSLVSVEDPAAGLEIPTANRLGQNYPNPFSRLTTIAYELATPTTVSLVLFDALGRQVAVLDVGLRQAGRHEVAFEASSVPSGTYLYRLTTDTGHQTRRMLVVK